LILIPEVRPNERSIAMSRRWWFLGLALAAGAAVIAGVLLFNSSESEDRLRWGGDDSGGAPYVFEDAHGNIIGFEADLAAYLASEMGRTSAFKSGVWKTLPTLLNRHDIDVVLNGYEWSPEREEKWASTIPYYIYQLQLLARANDNSIRSWDDLRAKPGQPKKRVGVLGESAAEAYLERHFGKDIQIKAFETGVTDVMKLVERDQDLDATVQDMPAVLYYERDFPKLRRVGEPLASGYYVMYVRKDDTQLRAHLNNALRKAIADGTLRRIYEKYHIWNRDQERLTNIAAAPWPPTDQAVREIGTWWHYGLELLQAAGMTVRLACAAMPLAIAIGLLVAVGRLYGPGWLRRLLEFYVEFLRGTPLLLQLYVLYFLLPEAGFRIGAFWAGVLALAINYSAYEAENYRAGLLAIPLGQMEAALALGMSKWTALRRVIIPQAVRVVIPPVTNDFIALFKDTSICSVIAVAELTGRYNKLYNTNPSLVLELGLMTALLYLLMSYPLSLLARRLERRFPRVVL
jgi:polar amino acid transport system substrate-binding protein